MTTSKRGFTDKLGLVLRSRMMKKFFSLANKGGKAKGKKSSCGGELSSKGEKKKKDISKIKCRLCHQFRHYSTKFPNRKKGSKKDQVAVSFEIVEFSSHFEKELSLVACMASSMTTSLWYVDNGASGHMTGKRNYFSKLSERGMQFDIEVGDDGKYQVEGTSIV